MLHLLYDLNVSTSTFYNCYDFTKGKPFQDDISLKIQISLMIYGGLVFQRICQFSSVELSAFYLDIIKDRLYIEKLTSLSRRSTQTVLYYVNQHKA
jgi:hypothetical protein